MYLGRLMSYWAIWWVKLPPISLITRCLKEWMYEDVSMTVHMSCPHSLTSEVFRSLLWIGTIQGSTDMHVSSSSKKNSDISIYCHPIITLQQVGVTLECWTPFSAKTLETKGILAPDFIHHIHQLRFVLSDCWTSNNYWWQTPIPGVSRTYNNMKSGCHPPSPNCDGLYVGYYF